MDGTFEELWVYAEKVVAWTNALLTPPPEHVLNLLGAAGQFPEIARRFVNGFDDPRDFHEWFMDPVKADAYLSEVAAVGLLSIPVRHMHTAAEVAQLSDVDAATRLLVAYARSLGDDVTFVR